MNALDQPKRSVIVDMATRYGMEPAAFEQTLRATVVPGNISKEQFAAFLLVAKEYGLNPLTREIFAFPARNGGIQPVVSVDGWLNLINSHPQLDGIEFEDTDASITCRIWRKDRAKPCTVTEYLAECNRGTEPWQKWPRRMLRHKALIQCARYAFGFAGIVDPDEFARFGPENDEGIRTQDARLRRSGDDDHRQPSLISPPSPPKVAAVPDFDPNTGEVWDDPPVEVPPPVSLSQRPPVADKVAPPAGSSASFRQRGAARRKRDEPTDAEIERSQQMLGALLGEDDTLNEKDWLNQLEGAFLGAQDMVSLGLLRDKLMLPSLHLASPDARRRAKLMLDENASRILEHNRDQGGVPQG